MLLRGSGFRPGDRVLFGARSALRVEVISAREIVATSPQGLGAAPVAVLGPNGRADAPEPFVFVPWRPAPGTSWQWQISSPPAPGQISTRFAVYDVDLFDTPASTVAAMHLRGIRAVCYVDAGMWEDWRPDAGRFPRSLLGRANGWPGERWLDIRRLPVLEPRMAARLRLCRAKGFDGVEADNVDAYANATGFPISARDQMRYNRWLAAYAHGLGLAIALKNDYGQMAALAPRFDFAVAESCRRYRECADLLPFVRRHAAVLEVEYGPGGAGWCAAAARRSFSALFQRPDIGAWSRACPGMRPAPPYRVEIRARTGPNGGLLLTARVLYGAGRPLAGDGLLWAPAGAGCGALSPLSPRTGAAGRAAAVLGPSAPGLRRERPRARRRGGRDVLGALTRRGRGPAPQGGTGPRRHSGWGAAVRRSGGRGARAPRG